MPILQVHEPDGEWRASCLHAEDAACLVAFLGDGATIRVRRDVICWTEGVDGQAAESYDATAQVVYHRAVAICPTPLHVPRL